MRFDVALDIYSAGTSEGSIDQCSKLGIPMAALLKFDTLSKFYDMVFSAWPRRVIFASAPSRSLGCTEQWLKQSECARSSFLSENYGKINRFIIHASDRHTCPSREHDTPVQVLSLAVGNASQPQRTRGRYCRISSSRML